MEPVTPWTETPRAIKALASLTVDDLRIVATHDTMGNYVMQFAPTASGMKACGILTQCHDMQMEVLSQQFRDACEVGNEPLVNSILERSAQVPTVSGAVGQRFGSANRFKGIEPMDATRRFRQNCRDIGGLAA